jgi:dimethylhistidine N-methyltransferase
MSQFLQDVVQGLSAKDKFLNSKYFYDQKGDKLFQQIMACPEYYPTKCEMEIFRQQTKQVSNLLINYVSTFDIVELGAGDASKSVHLLNELLQNNINFTYFPVDISGNVINLLHEELPKKLPALQLQALNGEYLQMLEKAKTISGKTKVVLFLGGNIGNVPLEKAGQFCNRLRQQLSSGDLVLTGFDLKKDPRVVLAAYNDKSGYTRSFNLNLLCRINDELKGNFVIENFDHYPTYDPATGACKSYLVSTIDQQVQIGKHIFSFTGGEPVFMEISQKYTVEQTDDLANQNGFTPIKHFFDSKSWFLDALWQCV